MTKRWAFKYHTVLNLITRPRPARLCSLVTEATSKKKPKADQSCQELPRASQRRPELQLPIDTQS